MATDDRHDPTPHDPTPHDPALARRLILDERFAQSLDQPLQGITQNHVKWVLDE